MRHLLPIIALALSGCGQSAARKAVTSAGDQIAETPWWQMSVTDIVTLSCTVGAGLGSAMFFIGIIMAVFTSKPTGKIILGGLAMIFAASILGLLVLWLKIAAWLAVIACLVGAVAYAYLHRKVAVWWIERKTRKNWDSDPSIGKPDDWDDQGDALETDTDLR